MNVIALSLGLLIFLTSQINHLEGTGHNRIDDRKLFEAFTEQKTDKKEVSARNCNFYAKRSYENGTYSIKISRDKTITAHCSWYKDKTYTLVQRRGQYGNPINYFYRSWSAYERGFGEHNEEYWLGLDNLRELTRSSPMDLIITLYDQNNDLQSITLQNISLGSNSSGYKLSYEGVTTDNLNLLGGLPVVNTSFSTWDRDFSSSSCASLTKGAWWFEVRKCFNSNLNGLNLAGEILDKNYSKGLGILWESLSGLNYSIKKSIMRITDHDPSKDSTKKYILPSAPTTVPEVVKSQSKKRIAQQDVKNAIEATLDVSNLITSVDKKNKSSIISHLPTIAYEAVFCKEDLIILGCGNDKGMLRVIETSSVNKCGSKGAHSMKHEDCFSIRGDFFLNHLQNQCNGKSHCMIGSNDKHLRKKDSCQEKDVGINVVFVCTNMKIPSINGTQSIDSDYKLRYSIDRSTSSENKYYYNSVNNSDSWILIDLKSYTPLSSIVVTFHSAVNESDVQLASYNRPVRNKSPALEDMECSLNNEMVDKRTIRAQCDHQRRGRYIWMQMKEDKSFKIDEIFVRLKPDTFIDDCLVSHKTMHVQDSMDTFDQIPLENCREMCGLLSKCIGFSYNLENGSCVLSNSSKSVDATEFNVSGNKSCIGDVKEHELQKECRHESTKASGMLLREYPSVASVNLCYSICQQLDKCKMFTYDRNTSICILFERAELSERGHDFVTGDKACDGNILDCFVYEAEYEGTDIDTVRNVASIQSCQKLCQQIPYCFFWTYFSDQEECKRKSSVRKILQRSFGTSGSRNCKSSIIKNVEFIGKGSLHKYLDIHTTDGCRKMCQEDSQCSVWSLYATSTNKSLQICETRHSYSDIAFNHVCQSGFKWRMFMPRNVKDIDCSWRSMKIDTEPLKQINGRVHSQDQCQYFCRVTDKCVYWSYQSKKGKCSLFNNPSLAKIVNDLDYISGPKYCDGTCFAKNMRINSESVRTMNDIETSEDCQNQCKNDMRCHGFNFIRSSNKCVLVKEGPRSFDSQVISGDKRCNTDHRMKFVELRDCYEHGIDYTQGDFMQVRGIIASWECQLECQKVQRCRFWTFDHHCYLKTDNKGLKYVSRKNVVSGPKYCLAYKQDVEITEGHFRTVQNIRSASACHQECRNSTRCNFFSYNPLQSECHLKKNSTLSYKKHFVSGSKVENVEDDFKTPHPLIPSSEDIPNCFSYGIKFETSGSVVEMNKTVDSVEMCHKYCKYRGEGCDFFVFFKQRRECFLLEGELRRSRPCSDSNDCISGPSDCKDCFEHGLKKAGRISNTHSRIHSPNHCQLICKEDVKCTSWHYDLKMLNCHLYKSVDERKAFIGANYVYGIKYCGRADSPYKPMITREKSYLTSVCFLEHVKYKGDDIDRIESVYSSQECQKLCQTIDNCRFWSWNYETQICYRKSGKFVRNLAGRQNYFSGPRVCENCFRKGINLEAEDILKIEKIVSPRDCQILCQETDDCVLWTLIGRTCHLRKGEIKLIHIESDAVSGAPECSFVLDYKDSVSGEVCISDNMKYEGTPLLKVKTSDYKECELSCVKNPFCTYWTFDKEKMSCTISNDRKATNFHKTSFVSGEIECKQGCYEYNVNYMGPSLEVTSKVYRPEFCQYLCQGNAKCKHWTYIPFNSHCILKSDDIQQSFKRDYRTLYISGPKFCKLKKLLEQNEISCRTMGYSFSKDVTLTANDPEKCFNHCKNKVDCQGWTFGAPNECYLTNKNNSLFKDAPKISSPKTCKDCFFHGIQYSPPYMKTFQNVLDAFDCQRHCMNATGCSGFTFLSKQRHCQLSSVTEDSYLQKDAISGPQNCIFELKANRMSRISIDTIQNRQHNRDVITIRNRETQLLEVKDRSTEWYQKHLSTDQLSTFISRSMAKKLNLTSISYRELALKPKNISAHEPLNLISEFNGIISNSTDDLTHILESEEGSKGEKRDSKDNSTVTDGIITLIKSPIEPKNHSSSGDDEAISELFLDEKPETTTSHSTTKKIHSLLGFKRVENSKKPKSISGYDHSEASPKESPGISKTKSNVVEVKKDITFSKEDSRISKASQKAADGDSFRADDSILDDHILQNGIQILLGDHDGRIDDVTQDYDDYDDGCFAEGVRLLTPNVDVYSSLNNPYQCAVVCQLHSECKGWTFLYKTKVCDIKGSFSSFDLKTDYHAVSGERSCKVDTTLF